nr:MAG TPA: hypothetical protein [Caudoviricetes sp.]DAL03230.1 MAG TPA: hypothetical protein [Caudoviricetes sp.]
MHIVQQICSGFILQIGYDFLRLASSFAGGRKSGKGGMRRLSEGSRCKLIKPARCLAGFFIVWQRGFIHRAVFYGQQPKPLP